MARKVNKLLKRGFKGRKETEGILIPGPVQGQRF
jgi:hypothetical protein